MFKNCLQILLVLILIFLLVCVRMFENQLFYDPFLEYFKSSSSTNVLPKVDNFKLFISLFVRYFLNTLISLTIIYVLFKDLILVKFTAVLYVIFFLILILLFFVVYHYFGQNHKMLLFYVRRFIIQPLFLLLFVPAFYFQKNIKS